MARIERDIRCTSNQYLECAYSTWMSTARAPCAQKITTKKRTRNLAASLPSPRFGWVTFCGMENDIPRFQATLARLLALFESVPESLVDSKPSAQDWSIKEIACHLVDSASNNHQRFTHLQRTRRLVFPPYEPEPWVAVEKPEGMAWKTLLDLVRCYNAFVLHLVSNLDRACLGNVWIVGDEERSLEFLARDYYRHLDWHINHLQSRISQVRALSPAAGG